MASVVSSGLALFILTSFLVQVDSYPRRYTSVVSDVHKFYGTSSIFFVLSRNNRRLEDYTSAQSLSRDFSRKYDFTSIIHFDQVDQYTKRYHKRIRRPLLVVFLRSSGDIAEFTGNAKFTSELSIWLVIFDDQSGSSALCEYCKSPKGNSFRLRFDTEMLVLCCDSLVMKQWWSIDGDHTEVSGVAVWTDGNRDGLRFHDRAVFNARRHDVKGAGIRIGLVEGSVLAHEVNGELQGFNGEILNELKRCMNFTITGIVRSLVYGDFNSTTKNWTGLVGRLTQGECEIGVDGFMILSDRLHVLDFTTSLLTARIRLYIKDPATTRDSVHWTAYFQVFSDDLWIFVIVLIIVVPSLLAVMEVFTSSRSFSSLIAGRYLDVWGIFCQQGLCEFPTRPSLGIAYFSILMLAFTISAAYSASLVSFLAISLPSLPFTTLEGFVDDGSYRLITLRNSATYDFLSKSTDPVLKKMMKLMKPVEELPESVSAAWEQVCQGPDAFYFADVLPLEMSRRNASCKLTSIDFGYIANFAMAMPAGSPYRRAINHYIQRLKDTGVVDRIKHRYFDFEKPSSSAVADYNRIDMRDVMPVLVILIGGIILALLVLLSEAMYNAVETYLRNRRRGRRSRKSRTMTSSNIQLPFIL